VFWCAADDQRPAKPAVRAARTSVSSFLRFESVSSATSVGSDMRRIPITLIVVMVATATLVAQRGKRVSSFQLVEASIAEMRTALEQHRITSVELVTQYLVRIATYEDLLHAALAVNPNAVKEAGERDQERARGRVRGPLHGIPIAVKDNIQTTDMPTTGGALAFAGFVPPYEATLVRNLRDAGAIVIAKTGMTELANWVAGAPTPMPTNYNAVGGFGFNPFDPRRDPRPLTFDGRPALGTGGSSSGVGTSANLWAASVGTETSGSILSPSNQTMLAGIKPTVGRISRYGVIPITGDQDTPGPMAKWVRDAAILLGVLEGAAPDPNDPATRRCPPPPGRSYLPFLRADGLRGARIGIPRAYFYDRVTPSSLRDGGGLNAAQASVMAEAIDVLRAQGAVIVDPADIPSVVDKDPGRNFVAWKICSGVGDAHGQDDDCSIVFKYGMKRDFNAWLATLGPGAPVKSLGELRAWNLAHQSAGSLKYGQANLDISDEMDVERDHERYEADRAKDLELAAKHGIDEVMQAERLDALLFPGGTGASLAARPGYPSVIVPFGMIPNAPTPPFPEGFDAKLQPFGVTFTGLACSEPKLLTLAYAFEWATKRRVPPPLPPGGSLSAAR
jgi:amidase